MGQPRELLLTLLMGYGLVWIGEDGEIEGFWVVGEVGGVWMCWDFAWAPVAVFCASMLWVICGEGRPVVKSRQAGQTIFMAG